MKSNLYAFMIVMWLLILGGGGIAVLILGPIQISGFGDMDRVITSILKAAAAVALVIVWILILARLKNWIFHREISS